MTSTNDTLSRKVGVTYPAISKKGPNGLRKYHSIFSDESDDSYTEAYTTRVPRSMLLGRRSTREKGHNQLADTEKFCNMYKEGFVVGAESNGADTALVEAQEERRQKGLLTEKWFVEGFCDGYKFAQNKSFSREQIADAYRVKVEPQQIEDEKISPFRPDDETLQKLATEMREVLELNLRATGDDINEVPSVDDIFNSNTFENYSTFFINKFIERYKDTDTSHYGLNEKFLMRSAAKHYGLNETISNWFSASVYCMLKHDPVEIKRTLENTEHKYALDLQREKPVQNESIYIDLMGTYSSAYEDTLHNILFKNIGLFNQIESHVQEDDLITFYDFCVKCDFVIDVIEDKIQPLKNRLEEDQDDETLSYYSDSELDNRGAMETYVWDGAKRFSFSVDMNYKKEKLEYDTMSDVELYYAALCMHIGALAPREQLLTIELEYPETATNVTLIKPKSNLEYPSVILALAYFMEAGKEELENFFDQVPDKVDIERLRPSENRNSVPPNINKDLVQPVFKIPNTGDKILPRLANLYEQYVSTRTWPQMNFDYFPVNVRQETINDDVYKNGRWKSENKMRAVQYAHLTGNTWDALNLKEVTLPTLLKHGTTSSRACVLFRPSTTVNEANAELYRLWTLYTKESNNTSTYNKFRGELIKIVHEDDKTFIGEILEEWTKSAESVSPRNILFRLRPVERYRSNYGYIRAIAYNLYQNQVNDWREEDKWDRQRIMEYQPFFHPKASKVTPICNFFYEKLAKFWVENREVYEGNVENEQEKIDTMKEDLRRIILSEDVDKLPDNVLSTPLFFDMIEPLMPEVNPSEDKLVYPNEYIEDTITDTSNLSVAVSGYSADRSDTSDMEE